MADPQHQPTIRRIRAGGGGLLAGAMGEAMMGARVKRASPAPKRKRNPKAAAQAALRL